MKTLAGQAAVLDWTLIFFYLLFVLASSPRQALGSGVSPGKGQGTLTGSGPGSENLTSTAPGASQI